GSKLVPDLPAIPRRAVQPGPLYVGWLCDVRQRKAHPPCRAGRWRPAWTTARSGCRPGSARPVTMQRKVLVLAAICAVLVVLRALPAWAHHSHNAYEVTEWTAIEGTVTEIQYRLPH